MTTHREIEMREQYAQDGIVWDALLEALADAINAGESAEGRFDWLLDVHLRAMRQACEGVQGRMMELEDAEREGAA